MPDPSASAAAPAAAVCRVPKNGRVCRSVRERAPCVAHAARTCAFMHRDEAGYLEAKARNASEAMSTYASWVRDVRMRAAGIAPPPRETDDGRPREARLPPIATPDVREWGAAPLPPLPPPLLLRQQLPQRDAAAASPPNRFAALGDEG